MSKRQLKRDDYLNKVNIIIEFINNNLDEKLSLNHLAKISNLSPFHFHKITRAILGEPIGHFISRTRIETAAKLLRYTKLSIEDIAYSIGYESPSSLSKSFKKFYAISPKSYRTNSSYAIIEPIQMEQDIPLNGPKIVNLPSYKVVYIRLTGDYAQLDYQTGNEKLWRFIGNNNLYSPTMQSIGISHDDPKVTDKEHCRYDICATISSDSNINPQGEIGFKTLDGGKYARFVHQGPYNQLGLIYNAIFRQWLLNSQYELRNTSTFDKYLNYPNNSNNQTLITEIYIPIK